HTRRWRGLFGAAELESLHSPYVRLYSTSHAARQKCLLYIRQEIAGPHKKRIPERRCAAAAAHRARSSYLSVLDVCPYAVDPVARPGTTTASRRNRLPARR